MTTSDCLVGFKIVYCLVRELFCASGECCLSCVIFGDVCVGF